MSGVFISYRRRDASDEAQQVAEDLRRKFGRKQVFIDVDDIEPGSRWEQVIDERLAAIDAFVLIIGPDWADAQDRDGNLRLFNPEDHVRGEIVAALNAGVPVIPVLVDGASMPRKDQMPEDLHPIREFNALIAGAGDIGDDVDRLAKTLKDDLAVKSVAARAGGGLLYTWTTGWGFIAFMFLLTIQTCSFSFGDEPAEPEPARPLGLAVLVIILLIGLFVVIMVRRAMRARRDARRVAVTVLLYLIGPVFAILAIWAGAAIDPPPP